MSLQSAANMTGSLLNGSLAVLQGFSRMYRMVCESTVAQAPKPLIRKRRDHNSTFEMMFADAHSTLLEDFIVVTESENSGLVAKSMTTEISVVSSEESMAGSTNDIFNTTLMSRKTKLSKGPALIDAADDEFKLRSIEKYSSFVDKFHLRSIGECSSFVEESDEVIDCVSDMAKENSVSQSICSECFQRNLDPSINIYSKVAEKHLRPLADAQSILREAEKRGITSACDRNLDDDSTNLRQLLSSNVKNDEKTFESNFIERTKLKFDVFKKIGAPVLAIVPPSRCLSSSQSGNIIKSSSNRNHCHKDVGGVYKDVVSASDNSQTLSRTKQLCAELSGMLQNIKNVSEEKTISLFNQKSLSRGGQLLDELSNKIFIKKPKDN